MTRICSKLLAHITNDAGMNGTDLGGFDFHAAIRYLQQYLAKYSSLVPAKYKTISLNLDFLATVSLTLQTISTKANFHNELTQLVEQIFCKLIALRENEHLYLPGGWTQHAMIYIWEKTPRGYQFSLLNTGAGLTAHLTKPNTDKNLYNPMRIWDIQGMPNAVELKLFIKRLLKPKLLAAQSEYKVPVNANILYKHILPSIAFINGVELNANLVLSAMIDNKALENDLYTPGQVSASCTQRCLHQLLKLHSPTLNDFLRFIYSFKQYAISDYAKECKNGTITFTDAAAARVFEGIENTTRLLKIPGLFTEDFITRQITHIEQTKALFQTMARQEITNTITQLPLLKMGSFKIKGEPASFETPTLKKPEVFEPVPLQLPLKDSFSFLANFQKLYEQVAAAKNPFYKYCLIEQIVLQLPHEEDSDLPLALFLTESELMDFESCLEKLIDELLLARETYFKEKQTPDLLILSLILVHLLIQTHEYLNRLTGQPDFRPFTSPILYAILKANTLNPFLGTNNPILDKKLVKLIQNYPEASPKNRASFFYYLNSVLETCSKSNKALIKQFDDEYGLRNNSLIAEIKEYRLKSLYILSLHLDKGNVINEKRYADILSRLGKHLAYENRLNKLLSPFYESPTHFQQLQFYFYSKTLMVYTSLLPVNKPNDALSKGMANYKYLVTNPQSPAYKTLENDLPDGYLLNFLKGKNSSNLIQLTPLDKSKSNNRKIQVDDLEARRYRHLRLHPALQIPLTLDYFNQRISELASQANRVFLEANLFQPGLLLEEMTNARFKQQSTSLIETGYRYFMRMGKHSEESLFFLRLDYLLANYALKMALPDGLERITRLQAMIEEQLTQENPEPIQGSLYHYLFLCLISNAKDLTRKQRHLELALTAGFYLKSHNAQAYHLDFSDTLAFEKAYFVFQNQLTQVARHYANNPDRQLIRLMFKAVENVYPNLLKDTIYRGAYPLFQFRHKVTQEDFYINLFETKLIKNGYIQAAIPLALQSNPILQRLGLGHTKSCQLSMDGSRLILQDTIGSPYCIAIQNGRIQVQKAWTIQGKTQYYQLQALTAEHPVYQYSKGEILVEHELPPLLKDYSMDYWQATTDNSGILSKNNQPVYLSDQVTLYSLDNHGNLNGKRPVFLNSHYANLFTRFEACEFILEESSSDNSFWHFQRYNLSFTLDKTQTKSRIINQQTGEFLTANSYIHPSVAGLCLESKTGNKRYLVPSVQFHAIHRNPDENDYYQVMHDTYNTIPTTQLKEKYRKKTLLWNYQNSQTYLSYAIINHKPVPATVTEALYLAYLYLATDQTLMAWNTLDDCLNRHNGLTGDKMQLQYLSWICQDIPYILASPNALKAARRSNYTYVTCKLQAIALICEFLLRGGVFVTAPQINPVTNATDEWHNLQRQNQLDFLDNLRSCIGALYTQYQILKRHQKYPYLLSFKANKDILDYYYQKLTQGELPLDAIGYSWVAQRLLVCRMEQHALQAHTMPTVYRKLDDIKTRVEQTPAVLGQCMLMEPQVLDIPLEINQVPMTAHLTDDCLKILNQWEHKPLGAEASEYSPPRLLHLLTSELSEEDLLINFPFFCHQAIHGDTMSVARISEYSKKALIATRYVDAKAQRNNIPFLCNLLYRISHHAASLKSSEPGSIRALVNLLIDRPVPPIPVMQQTSLANVILAKPADILPQLPFGSAQPLVLPKTASIAFMQALGLQQSLDALDVENSRQLHHMLQEFQGNQQQSASAIEALGNELESVNKSVLPALLLERKAGKLLFELQGKQQTLAQKLVDNPELLKSLVQAANQCLKNASTLLAPLWARAFATAKEGQRASNWHLQVLANEKPQEITKDLLRSIYAKADSAYTASLLGLNLQQSQRLHEETHAAYLQSIKVQVLQKLIKGMEEPDFNQNMHKLVALLELLARPVLSMLDTPAQVLIQHELELLLRPRQIAAIQNLLAKNDVGVWDEIIEKITMGGGKTKIILPLVLEEKANGSNLVVVEVPHALFETNFIDLHTLSQKLFGKRAYKFEFDRNNDCSVASLERLYETLLQVMLSRSYLVTTAECRRSLNAKYIEIMLVEPSDRNPDWEQQVAAIDRIQHLFKHHGDAIIDEVHHGLSLKRKLNYTVGHSSSVSHSLIKDAVALYGLIDMELIKNAYKKDPKHDWSSFKEKLAKDLVHCAQSPIADFILEAVRKHGPAIKDTLVAYFIDTSFRSCQAITDASPQIQSACRFLKKQIQVLLPYTLGRRLRVHYGPSDLTDISPVERALAIPYESSDLPLNDTRFGNVMEAINTTIQMMLIDGVSKELLAEQIRLWQSQANQELFYNRECKHIDQTPLARRLESMLGPLECKLSQINPQNTQQMERIHTSLQQHRSCLFYLLEQLVLPKIQQDSNIISIDSFNHVDSYHSVQAIGGTPSRGRIYHPRLRQNRKESLGMDGYILEILMHKQTPVRYCDFLQINQFITTILANASPDRPCRAIIDTNATLNGVCNLAIAQEVAAYFRARYGAASGLEHVLYFNKNQLLSAIAIEAPNQPILIGTTEPDQIDAVLGHNRDKRFIIYDQQHCIGIDLPLGPHSHALVLIDEKLSLTAFVQGCMRLRELPKEQSVELIAADHLRHYDREAFFNQFISNEEGEIYKQNRHAINEQLPNEIRQHLLDSLQSLPSREAAKKHAIAKQFEPFFAETQEADMLREHPEFRQSLPTKALLDSRKDYLLQQVVNCEKSSPTEEARVELSALDNKLTSLINEALPHLLSEYEDTDDWLSLEVKKQKQVQTQLELRFVQLNESYNPDLLADQSQPWIAFKNIEDLFTKDIHRRHWQSMNSFCGQAKRQIKLFDEDLLVCTTFAKTYRNQSKNLSAFLKDSFLVLYYKNPVSRKLQAMLITIDDAIPLQALCSKKQGIWIASTEDTQYAGNVPESILHEASYQRLREQIRFFNGEFDALVHNTNTLLWLCENTKEKLEFFESDLLPYKPHASKAFATLRSNLLQNDKEHYQYVKAHAFEDLSNLAWHTSEEKTKEYQSVAKALLFMNSHVSPCQLGIDQIRSTFAVPQRSLLFLKQHLSLIQTLHHFLDYLQAQTTHQFMMNPPAEFGECLEYFIGMSMDDFRQKEAIRCSFNQSLHTINWELATLAALLLLSKHPYVKDNPVIAAYLLSRAKKTSYTSVLLKLVHSTTLSDSMLQAILKNPACNTLVLTALGRKESLLNETLTLGSASPSTKAKNRFFNPNHSPSTKPQSTALTSESVNPMI